MKGAWGFVLFLSLSLAVHAAILVTLPDGGNAGQGAGGEDTLTLTASAAAFSTLIDMWDQAPDTAPQPVLSVPDVSAVDTPNIASEAPIQRLTFPEITAADPERRPSPQTSSAPVPNLSAVPPIVAPTLVLPTLPDEANAPNTSSDTRPTMSAPELAVPEAISQPSSPDDRSHFEGSTTLATDRSPRPGPRPDDLAPQPQAPVATAQPAAPQQPATPAPDRTAAGTGSGETQGATPTPAPQPGLSPGQIQSLVAQWGGQIQARIARSRPSVDGTGRAIVRLSVAPNGRLVALGIARSSGNSAVDQAALSAVQRAGRFPRAPRQLTDASYSFSVPLTFQ